jgi:hypothetical protein
MSDLRPEARALFQAGRTVFSPTGADLVRVFAALVRELQVAVHKRPRTYSRTRRIAHRSDLPEC